MPEMKSLTLNDKTYDSFVDPVARTLAAGAAVINSASGEVVTMSDASDLTLYGLNIYGKTTQDGTPTPDAPIDLVSNGESGSITVTVTGEDEARSVTVATPNGLPGIPVASGGNYTDTNGQQWICDEIDLARAVHVQRIGDIELDATSVRWKDGIFTSGSVHYIYLDDPSIVISNGSLCTHATYEPNGMLENGKYCDSGAGYFQVVTDLTLEEWRSYLVEQKARGTPVSLLYVLSNIVETPLRADELAAYKDLRTYRGTTRVSNDADAYMDVEYVMNAKKYIDSLVTGAIIPATVE